MTSAPAAIDYMVRRVSGLLVAEELRAGAESAGLELGLRDAARADSTIAPLPILASLNSARMGAILVEYILPRIDQRLRRFARRCGSERFQEQPSPGRWLRWTPYERRVLAAVLYEFCKQLKMLDQALQQRSGDRAAPTIALLIPSLASLRKRAARSLNHLPAIDRQACVEAQRDVQGVVSRFEECLASTDEAAICRAAWLEPYRIEAAALVDESRVFSPLLRELVEWRKRHLQISTGLGPGRHLPLNVLPSPSELYELWCFLELGAAMADRGLLDGDRWTLCRAVPSGVHIGEWPEYENYRSYLGRSWEAPRFSAALRMLVPHVLASRTCGRATRVVVTAKYGPWSPSDALAALGWRSVAGADHAIAFFSRPVESRAYREHRMSGEVLIMPVPAKVEGGDRAGFVAAASLVPAFENADHNAQVLTTLAREFFPR
jgi:hypothetical protein